MTAQPKYAFSVLFSLLSIVCISQPMELAVVHLESDVRPIYATHMQSDKVGNIWISSSRGLYRIDGYKGYFYTDNPNDSLSLKHNNVFGSYTDWNGDVWVCSDKGVQKYLPSRNGFEQKALKYFDHSTDLYALSVYDLIQISQETFLFGTKLGLFEYHLGQDDIVAYHPLSKERTGDHFSTNEHVYKIASEKGTQNYYILSRAGVFLFDASTKVIQNLNHPEASFYKQMNTPFVDLEVNSDYVVAYSRNQIWAFDLMKEDWFQIDIRTDVVNDLGVPIELSGVTIRDLLFKNNEAMYISTISTGMFVLNLKKRKIELDSTITMDGNRVMTLNKMTYDQNGFMWTLVDPSQIVRSKKSVRTAAQNLNRQIYLDRFTINNQPFDLQNLSLDHDVLKLTNYQRQVLFKYAVVNPPNKDSIQYSYKLNGFDKSWVETGTNRTANYTKLGPGNYEFHVRAKIGEEQVNKQLIRLEIPKYFYETWWFRLGIAFLVLGIGAVLYTIQRRRKTDLAQFNIQLRDMELQALRSQMNPHFLFNTLNSIKNYVLTKGPDEAADYLTKFSQLIRKILENSKQSLLSLEQEIEAMELYVQMEYLRFNKDFKYSFDVDSEINTHRFRIAPMIIQPFIENAIWHGLMNKRGEKKLTITFQAIAEGVLCVIEDNGIGRAASQLQNEGMPTNKKSLGMKITGDRVENINQLYHINLTVRIIDLLEGEKGKGTRVEIVLPYIHEKILTK